MAKKPKQVQDDLIDTSEGGLLTTGMQAVELSDTQVTETSVDEDGMPMGENMVPEVSDVVVSADVSTDPMQSIAATLVACGRMYEDAGKLSVALTHWLPGVAAQPELHSFLQRMQLAMGELRHAIKQNEDMISDELREAIVAAVS